MKVLDSSKRVSPLLSPKQQERNQLQKAGASATT